MLFRINNSYLYYDNNVGVINDYYQMIVELIKHFNISVCPYVTAIISKIGLLICYKNLCGFNI